MELLTETDYEYTGLGVFVSFEPLYVSEKYKSTIPNLILNGVTLKSSELNLGAECTLFFINGVIDFLEIWSVDGEYPRHELYDYVLKQEWKDSPQLKIEKKNNKTPQS